jgi:hypothetical protein
MFSASDLRWADFYRKPSATPRSPPAKHLRLPHRGGEIRIGKSTASRARPVRSQADYRRAVRPRLPGTVCRRLLKKLGFSHTSARLAVPLKTSILSRLSAQLSARLAEVPDHPTPLRYASTFYFGIRPSSSIGCSRLSNAGVFLVAYQPKGRRTSIRG